MSQANKRFISEYQNVLIFLLSVIIAFDIALIAYRKYHKPEITITQNASELPSQKLDVNKASVNELECIPGLTRQLAENIVKYRKNYCKRFPSREAFAELEDLLKVKGVSNKIFLRIKRYLTVSSKNYSSHIK